MKNDLTTQILLLIAGAIAGIFSGAVGAAYKAYLDRKSESQKSEAAIRLQYLYPLLVVAIDLKRKLSHAYETVQGEKDITTPEPQMTDRYYLRHWFWKCKEYVVNPDSVSGSSLNSSASLNSSNGHPTIICDTPNSLRCGRTRTRAMSVGKDSRGDRPANPRGGRPYALVNDSRRTRRLVL